MSIRVEGSGNEEGLGSQVEARDVGAEILYGGAIEIRTVRCAGGCGMVGEGFNLPPPHHLFVDPDGVVYPGKSSCVTGRDEKIKNLRRVGARLKDQAACQGAM
jgi:hypothetical protein